MRKLTEENLQWLACPVCHAGLRLNHDAVTCLGCGRRFPVLDGIALLLETKASTKD